MEATSVPVIVSVVVLLLVVSSMVFPFLFAAMLLEEEVVYPAVGPSILFPVCGVAEQLVHLLVFDAMVLEGECA